MYTYTRTYMHNISGRIEKGYGNCFWRWCYLAEGYSERKKPMLTLPYIVYIFSILLHIHIITRTKRLKKVTSSLYTVSISGKG